MKSAVITKVIVATLVVGGAVGYFVYKAMASSWSYYYSVDELAQADPDASQHSLRIAGIVKAGSVKRDLENISAAFTLAGTNAQLPVEYRGQVPDNFEQGREVVVEGRLTESGVFHADLLMTRCESKYKAKVN